MEISIDSWNWTHEVPKCILYLSQISSNETYFACFGKTKIPCYEYAVASLWKFKIIIVLYLVATEPDQCKSILGFVDKYYGPWMHLVLLEKNVT